ncbi:MAG: hypothetical protein Q4B65_02085 [Candidatus Saccharibacteria bacterium]|nr:hypothetical protein [Candidatus Saccharibacteria bacterium]
MVMNITGYSTDIAKVERGDRVTMYCRTDKKEMIVVPDLLVAWSEEVPNLKARRIQLMKDLDDPFQKKYKILHFYNEPERDRVEIKN